MEINLNNCPEYIFAKHVLEIGSDLIEKEACNLLQQTERFGVKICQDKFVESYDQLTDDQYKWFFWWFNYNNELVLENKTIDENNCHPQGNWQDFDYTK